MSEAVRFQIFLALIGRATPESDEEVKASLESAARLEKAWLLDSEARRPKAPPPPPPAPQQLATIPQAPRTYAPPGGAVLGARVQASTPAPGAGVAFGARATGAPPMAGTGPIPPPGAAPPAGVSFSAPTMVMQGGQSAGAQAPARSIVFEGRQGVLRIDPATGAPLPEPAAAPAYPAPAYAPPAYPDPRMAAYAAAQTAVAPPAGMAGSSTPQPPTPAAQQWAQIRDAIQTAGLGETMARLRLAHDTGGAEGVTEVVNTLAEEVPLWLLEVGVLYEHGANQLGLSLLGIELGGFFAAQRAN